MAAEKYDTVYALLSINEWAPGSLAIFGVYAASEDAHKDKERFSTKVGDDSQDVRQYQRGRNGGYLMVYEMTVR